MDVSTKFEFNQEVWFEQNGKPEKDWVKLIILQNREENPPWIRYELTYYNGWLREVDLFATKEDCENEIVRLANVL
jgi:hypothetical protein